MFMVISIDYEKQIELIINDTPKAPGKPKGLNEEQKAQLRIYAEYMKKQNLRVRSRVEKLRVISSWMVTVGSDLTKPTYDDVNDFFDGLCEKAISTEVTQKYIVHSYLEWVLDDDEGISRKTQKLFKSGGQDITEMRKRVQISPDEILTEEEVISLIRHAPTPWEKGLISFTYGSAGRVSSICSMKWENIRIEGSNIYYSYPGLGKSGEGSKAPLLFTWELGVEWIITYLNEHPRKKEGEWLWLNSQSNQVTSFLLRKVLNRLKKVAKIPEKKKCRPHGLRHARITKLRKEGFDDKEIKEIAGWEAKSSTIERYSHLTREDTNKALRKHMGKTEVRINGVTEVKCPICKRVFPPDTFYCSNCGLNLEDKQTTTMEKMKEQMRKEIEAELEAKMEQKMFQMMTEMMAKISTGKMDTEKLKEDSQKLRQAIEDLKR